MELKLQVVKDVTSVIVDARPSASVELQAHREKEQTLLTYRSVGEDPVLIDTWPALVCWDYSAILSTRPYTQQEIEDIAKEEYYVVDLPRLYTAQGQQNVAAIRALNPGIQVIGYHTMHHVNNNFPSGRPLYEAHWNVWRGYESKHEDGTLAQAWQAYPGSLEAYWTRYTEVFPEDAGSGYARKLMQDWEAAWIALLPSYDEHPNGVLWDYISILSRGPYISPEAIAAFGKLDDNQDGTIYDLDAAEIDGYEAATRAHSTMLDRIYPAGTVAQIPNGEGTYPRHDTRNFASDFHGKNHEGFPDVLGGTNVFDVLDDMFDDEFKTPTPDARYRRYNGRPRFLLSLLTYDNVNTHDPTSSVMAARVCSMIFQQPWGRPNTNAGVFRNDPMPITGVGEAITLPQRIVIDANNKQYKRNYQGGLAIIAAKPATWQAYFHYGVYNDDPGPVDPEDPPHNPPTPGG